MTDIKVSLTDCSKLEAVTQGLIFANENVGEEALHLPVPSITSAEDGSKGSLIKTKLIYFIALP